MEIIITGTYVLFSNPVAAFLNLITLHFLFRKLYRPDMGYYTHNLHLSPVDVPLCRSTIS